MRQAEIWRRHFRARDNSAIGQIFEGQLCSSIACGKCDHVSLTFDNFMDLSIQLPNRGKKAGAVELVDLL